MHVLVTVGTTRFDALVDCVLGDLFLEAAREQGVTRVIVQAGNSTYTQQHDKDGIMVEVVKFTNQMKALIADADLVISHAGAGTILDVLDCTKNKRRGLVVCVNAGLMDNHQSQLAEKMSSLGHCLVASPHTLATVFRQWCVERENCAGNTFEFDRGKKLGVFLDNCVFE